VYDFVIVVLLALAALKLTDLLVQLVPRMAPAEVLLRFVVALAGVVALDSSLFSGFDVSLRESWMGPMATGLIAGALASAWRAMLGFLDPAERATTEPSTSERPRIAA
jgi:hypothetical protein